jgi:hypothetical protein
MREDDIKKSLGGGYQPHFFLVDKIVLAKIPPRAVEVIVKFLFLKKLPPSSPFLPFFRKVESSTEHICCARYMLLLLALTNDMHTAGIKPLLHTYLTNLQIWSGIQNVILSEMSNLWSENRTKLWL